ncbi:tetratricopeptide repeat protein [Uliginosibacterium sp. 31-12]|uniref:O-linked N-acetylglucosamine transferase, SPINDLY family protein n=1 Tax=Uliginosibacterium sp. 31-12 TaxID=3062781 RepID=UPI0026E33F91|nr:tetratricopeptide repeat protein [Uliginosibacterium sp. 31-12]MDO6386725.1 tetratricopeptide repeat protein [Uliginosibacterium sp. 31-12]
MLLDVLFDAFRERRAIRLNNRGDQLWQQGRTAEAENCFRSAIRTDPSCALAFSNLGMLLMARHRYEDGFKLIKRAAALNPTHSGILVNYGNGLMMAGQVQEAVRQYQKALELDPNNSRLAASLVRPLLDVCDWDGIDQLLARTRSRQDTDTALDVIQPFNALFLPLSRREQLNIARNCAKAYEREFTPLKPRTARSSPRIKVGYLSADFHDHATAHLTLGLYHRHDRSRFEVYAYSLGHPDEGLYRKKIMGDCDHFLDVHSLDDAQIATRIQADGIDILLDMKGYTGGSRPGILAMQPAPVQVNYLGYPGSMGADFVPYLIADPVLIPESHEIDYSERIVRLPDSYQPNDDQQAISERFQSREEAGLPAKGFVMCGFHASAKITRSTFTAWLELLKRIPGSVLWLLKLPPEAESRLNNACAAAGIDPSRMIQAQALPKADHLSRLRFADVFLDTFTCNAHTTASDALWAKVPVVTLTGETFASRVATSLLHAVWLPELCARSEIQYLEIVSNLAADPRLLSHLKLHLAQGNALPLFNTDRYVKNLDNVLEQLLAKHKVTT